jgi:hypothetical protein
MDCLDFRYRIPIRRAFATSVAEAMAGYESSSERVALRLKLRTSRIENGIFTSNHAEAANQVHRREIDWTSSSRPFVGRRKPTRSAPLRNIRTIRG